jgi:hypothetical protein
LVPERGGSCRHLGWPIINWAFGLMDPETSSG